MKRFFCALAGLVSLAGCNTQTTSTTTPTQTTEARPAAAPANSAGTDYQVYRTRLPGQADSLTLHLVTAPRGFDATGTAGRFGSYYGSNGRPYTLQGQPSAAPDSVVLFEISPEKAIDPNGSSLYWRLRRQPGGNLAGTVGQAPVRLRLVRLAAGALTFVVRYFADSLAAFPREARSPKAHLSVQALVPVGLPEAVRQALTTSMLRGLRGDTIDGIPSVSLAALYKQQRRDYFKSYREDAADSRPTPADTAGIGAYAPGLTYENQTAAHVLYQQGNLLSLGFLSYDYSGGAHGSYGTIGASYDLRTGRRLRYADIFQLAAAQQLPALLARAVRPLVGLQADEPLDKQLLVNKMPLTHNVFLTEGGAVFIYQPYEIASYAQGEIRVFLLLSELRPLLREGLPLPGSGVAAR
ncbi:hypothetical protein A0257_10350 [Hymenobacter psoromatis]|nr:hypothetical protein A0257_10350 [Hymenobacter psoromatis]